MAKLFVSTKGNVVVTYNKFGYIGSDVSFEQVDENFFIRFKSGKQIRITEQNAAEYSTALINNGFKNTEIYKDLCEKFSVNAETPIVEATQNCVAQYHKEYKMSDIVSSEEFLNKVFRTRSQSKKSVKGLKAALMGRTSKAAQVVLGILSRKGHNRDLHDAGLVGADIVNIGITKVTIAYQANPKSGYKTRVDVPVYLLDLNFASRTIKRMFCRDGKQVTFRDYLRFMISQCKDFPRLKIDLAHLDRNDSLVMCIDNLNSDDKLEWRGVANPELFGTRLVANKLDDSIFAIVRDGKVISPNTGTKLIARIHSIVNNTPLFKIKGVKVGVILDTDNQFLRETFSTGSLFVSSELTRKVGLSRVVSKTLGIKAVMSPMGKTASQEFIGVDAIAHAGCIKAGVRGVYAAVTGCLYEQAILATEEEVLSTIKAATKMVNTKWGVLPMVFVKEDLDVTNPYFMYGVQWAHEVKESDSLYTHAVDAFNNGFIDSLPEFIINGLNDGTMIRRKDRVSVKASDLQNIKLSYGNDVASEFLTKMKVSRNLRAHFCTIGDSFTEQESEEIMGYISKMWAGVVNPGSITPDNFRSQEDYILAMTFIMGGGNLSSGRMFPGLATEQDVVLTLGGEKFFFPGEINEESNFMAKEDDDITSGVNLGGTADEFIQLLISFRNVSTNWKQKAARFNAGISNIAFREEMNSFDVKGRYMAIVTPMWETKINRLETTNRNYIGRVSCKKDPVLFDKAVFDAYINEVSYEEFPEMDHVLEFIMKSVVFVNPLLQSGQGNDADGDLLCVMKTGGTLPVYDGQEVAKSYWDNYLNGEQEMNLLEKGLSIKEYEVESLTQVMETAAFNKASIGRMTSDLFIVQHGLDVAQRSFEWMSQHDARLIKEAYALTMQDEAVRAIKHESGSSLWEAMTFKSQSNAIDVYDGIIEAVKVKCDGKISTNTVRMFVSFMFSNLALSNVGAWRSAKVYTDKDGNPINLDEHFWGSANTFTTHSMFIRRTWTKAAGKLRANTSKFIFDTAEQYGEKGWSFVAMWTNRLAVGNRCVKAFHINAESSIIEEAYMKAHSKFIGSYTCEIEYFEEKEAAEEVSQEVEEVDISEYDGSLALFVTEPAKEIPVVELAQKGNTAVMSFKGHQKSVEVSDEGTPLANALNAILEALSALKKASVVKVSTDNHHVKNNVKKYLPKWAEDGVVPKTTKNREMWARIIELSQYHDIKWDV